MIKRFYAIHQENSCVVYNRLGLQVAAQGQVKYKGFTAFSWEMGFPFNEKYLDEPSYSGWRLEWRKMINSKFSAGLAVSWNAFDQQLGKELLLPRRCSGSHHRHDTPGIYCADNCHRALLLFKRR
jgi:hypothetical protein